MRQPGNYTLLITAIRLMLLSLMMLSLKNADAQTVQSAALANSMLKAGNHLAAITTYEFPEHIKVLQQKAIRNLKADPAWADKYAVRMVEKGTRDIQFMDAYGLSRNEFDTMTAAFRRGKQAVFTDTFQLSIKRTNDIISFKGEKVLSAFNHLTIDTKKNQIVFDNFLMTKELDVPGKFYAPALVGYETNSQYTFRDKKPVTQYSSAGLTLGRNEGSTRPTLALRLTKPAKPIAEWVFIIVTIL